MNAPQTLDATIASARSHRLADLLWRSAARVPHKTALVYGELRQTYAELDETVNRTANAIAARGVARGDHIALLSRNNHAFVVVRFALARLGAVLVPVNFMLNASEVAYILGNAEVRGVIAEDALAGVADAAIAEAGLTLKLRGAIRDKGSAVSGGWEWVQDWMRHADATAPDVPSATTSRCRCSTPAAPSRGPRARCCRRAACTTTTPAASSMAR